MNYILLYAKAHEVWGVLYTVSGFLHLSFPLL